MLVVATQQQKTIVMNKPTKAKDIKSFTSYGKLFGVSQAHPLIILKMTLDFKTNLLEYFNCARLSGLRHFRFMYMVLTDM